MKNIERFKLAQNEDSNYDFALQEIKNGKKLTHWIWFVFPQLEFLCQSDISIYYGIQDIEEARAYLIDYTLDTRLRRICSELLNHKGKDIKNIFGYPDYLKVKSCMTLFDYISPCDIFQEVLDAFYESGRCLATLTYLRNMKK